MKQGDMAALESGLANRRVFASGYWGRAGRFSGFVFAILLFWGLILVLVPVIQDTPGQYLVIGPERGRLEAINATPAKLVAQGWGYTQIESSSPNFVRQLYAQGAWLVLPASNGGCLSLADWRRLTQ